MNQVNVRKDSVENARMPRLYTYVTYLTLGLVGQVRKERGLKIGVVDQQRGTTETEA